MRDLLKSTLVRKALVVIGVLILVPVSIDQAVLRCKQESLPVVIP